MTIKRNQGFTLLELVITVVIIGIIAAIAYPNYTEYVRNARRSDAAAALMGLAAAMEQRYTANFSYTGNAAGGSDTGAPAVFASQVPTSGGTKSYDLRIVSATDNAYEVRAVPTGAQAGNGFLSLTSTGARGWDRNNDGVLGVGEGCWEMSC